MKRPIIDTKNMAPQQLKQIIEDLRMMWYTSPKQYGLRLLYTPNHKKKGYQSHGSKILRTTNF